MKLPYCVLLVFFLLKNADAQPVPDTPAKIPVITIDARLIGKDSVIIPYDAHYLAVQKPCVQIIRYGHYNAKLNIFLGKFKDINAVYPSKTVAEGSFSKYGLKDGHFVLHYLNDQLEGEGNFIKDTFDGDWVFYYPNGNLKAKGKFEKGKYIGNWEMYYENGRPFLFFEAENEICKIISAWNADGTKVVNEGNGSYRSGGAAPWMGKLSNGIPDSTWTCKITFGKDTLKPVSVVEYFKNGEFKRGDVTGRNFNRNYDDKSSISLFPRLPFLNINLSRGLKISTTCNGTELDEAYINIFNKIVHTKRIPLTGSKYEYIN